MNKPGFVCVLLSIVGSLAGQTKDSGKKLSLRDAVDIGLKNNPAILRLQSEIDAADGRILQAGKIPNPELGVSWNETPTSFNIGEANEFQVGIVQPIEFPTKRSARIGVAQSEKSIAELQLDHSKVLLAARIRNAYYKLLLGQVIVRSLEEQSGLLKDFQMLLTARLETGTSNYLDVVRSKVEFARTTIDITEAEREALSRTTELNLLLGRDGTTPLQLTDSLEIHPVSLDPDSVLQHSVENSFILRIAQRFIDRQQIALGLAKTSYLPDFSIGLSRQRTAEQPPFNANSFTGTTASTFSLQVGVSLPLWFWNEPKGQVQEASAQAHSAQLNLEATTRKIRISVLNALKAVNVAEAQLRVFDSSLLADVKDILTTGITQYRNNQIDVINLLDIYRTYRATNIEYARALTNYLVARSDLEAAAEQSLE